MLYYQHIFKHDGSFWRKLKTVQNKLYLLRFDAYDSVIDPMKTIFAFIVVGIDEIKCGLKTGHNDPILQSPFDTSVHKTVHNFEDLTNFEYPGQFKMGPHMEGIVKWLCLQLSETIFIVFNPHF